MSCSYSHFSNLNRFNLKNVKPAINILEFNTVDGWPSVCAQPTLDNLHGYGITRSKSLQKSTNQYWYKDILVYPDEWLFENNVWIQAKNIIPKLIPYL